MSAHPSALWWAYFGIIVVIPLAARNGRPQAFRPVHWVVLTVGAAVFVFILMLLWEVALLSLKPEWVSLVILSGAEIMISIGIGSLLAVFFCRPHGG